MPFLAPIGWLGDPPRRIQDLIIAERAIISWPILTSSLGLFGGVLLDPKSPNSCGRGLGGIVCPPGGGGHLWGMVAGLDLHGERANT